MNWGLVDVWKDKIKMMQLGLDASNYIAKAPAENWSCRVVCWFLDPAVKIRGK
jgi:hypothetical protein